MKKMFDLCKKSLKKDEWELAEKELRGCQFKTCFGVQLTKWYRRTHTPEEVRAEEKRIIDKCREILRKYEEEIRNNGDGECPENRKKSN